MLNVQSFFFEHPTLCSFKKSLWGSFYFEINIYKEIMRNFEWRFRKTHNIQVSLSSKLKFLLLFILYFLFSKDQTICFSFWLTNDIQFLYQDVSIFDFSFLSTYFFM